MSDTDPTPAGGIPRFGQGKRPLLRVAKNGQETSKSTRPVLSVQGRQRPTIQMNPMDNNVDNAPAKGIERPKLTLKTMDDIYGTPSKQKPGAPFDQDLEPDDPWAD